MTSEKIEECEASGRATAMTDIAAKYGKVNGRVAFDGMRKGDAAAKEVVDTYAKYIASGIASMINIFQPEVLSIGGGISGEGQLLLDLITPTVTAEMYGGDFIKPTRIVIAELGNDAGIVGAAFLGI